MVEWGRLFVVTVVKVRIQRQLEEQIKDMHILGCRGCRRKYILHTYKVTNNDRDAAIRDQWGEEGYLSDRSTGA